MEEYSKVIINAFIGTLDWTWKSIIFEVPWYTNYFWGLIVISLVVWTLEILFPIITCFESKHHIILSLLVVLGYISASAIGKHLSAMGAAASFVKSTTALF